MAGLYYEDFFVDQHFEHPITRTVTEMDNMLFCMLSMNPQPLHIDAHYAAGTEFGRPIVNSIFTLGLLIGISVPDTTLGTTIANLSMTDISFPRPVFHGDTLHVRTKVASMRESRSRPEVGLVELEHTCFNQNDELVATCRRMTMMKRRPA
jgi:acyl dehydratase